MMTKKNKYNFKNRMKWWLITSPVVFGFGFMCAEGVQLLIEDSGITTQFIAGWRMGLIAIGASLLIFIIGDKDTLGID